MTPYLQVMTTASSSEEAQRIGRELVERRLAGCVQIVGPITSIYQWQGAIETAAEWQCLVKTRHDRYDKVEQTIRELHSYDTPEILALPIAAGEGRYVKWLEEGLGAGDSGLRTQDSGLRTQDSGLTTRDSGLGTQDSGLGSGDWGRLSAIVPRRLAAAGV